MENNCHCGDVIDFLLFLTIALAVGSALYAIVHNWVYSPKNKNGGQIPPVKNPLPPPPDLRNAMPRADAPPAPPRFFASDAEVMIARKALEKHLSGMSANLSGVKKIIFKNGTELIVPTSSTVKKQTGEYKQNDDGLLLWTPTEEKPSSWVSDYVPPLDPPTSYSSDSDSSSSSSSTDFSGGDFGGGGAGGEY